MLNTPASTLGIHLRHHARIILSYLAFPAIMVSLVTIAWHSYRPETALLLLPALFLSVMLMAVCLERVFPFAPKWNSSWRDSRQDAAYFLLAQPVIALADAAAIALGTVLSIRLGAALGVSIWPASLPTFWQIPLALLISELPAYLYHRASHETNGLLWRIHAQHHAPQRVYSLNFVRFHPLNSFTSTFLMLLPLVALGVPGKVIFVVAAIQKCHSLLSHTNFDFRLGPLNWVFSMAELHRWHHVRDIQLANANYGSTLIFWDVLLGTRALPKSDVRNQEIGIFDEKQHANDMWRQILLAQQT